MTNTDKLFILKSAGSDVMSGYKVPTPVDDAQVKAQKKKVLPKSPNTTTEKPDASY